MLYIYQKLDLILKLQVTITKIFSKISNEIEAILLLMVAQVAESDITAQYNKILYKIFIFIGNMYTKKLVNQNHFRQIYQVF